MSEAVLLLVGVAFSALFLSLVALALLIVWTAWRLREFLFTNPREWSAGGCADVD